MQDDEFKKLIDSYLEPSGDPNIEMAGVTVVWIRDSEEYGSKHIEMKHGITEEEVEQVLFEVPPFVEARRHSDFPNRTVFWGATRFDRWLVVVCEDWKEGKERYLKPITAFEPEEGEDYWRRQ